MNNNQDWCIQFQSTIAQIQSGQHDKIDLEFVLDEMECWAYFLKSRPWELVGDLIKNIYYDEMGFDSKSNVQDLTIKLTQFLSKSKFWEREQNWEAIIDHSISTKCIDDKDYIVDKSHLMSLLPECVATNSIWDVDAINETLMQAKLGNINSLVANVLEYQINESKYYIRAALRTILLHLGLQRYQAEWKQHNWNVLLSRCRYELESKFECAPSLHEYTSSQIKNEWDIVMPMLDVLTRWDYQCIPSVCEWDIHQVLDENYVPTSYLGLFSNRYAYCSCPDLADTRPKE